MTDNIIHAVHEESEGEGIQDEPSVDPTAEVMAAVRVEMKSNKAQIVTEVKEQTYPAIEAAVKRAMEGLKAKGSNKRKRKQTTFKNKGNERRHEANEDILETIEEAIEAIGDKDLDAAKKSLEAGRKLILKQQKLVKMADREENGWEVVRHYLSDDLADDADDEKDIKRARREALASIRKRNFQRGKGDKFRNDYRGKSYGDYGYGESSSSQSSGYGESGTRRRYGNTASTDRRGATICYSCRREGHVQYLCPNRFNRR